MRTPQAVRGSLATAAAQLALVADEALSCRAQVEQVRLDLQELAGATLTRAESARLLGVSQTALDRWIQRGEIAAVLTPEGRREVPTAHVVDLLTDVMRSRDAGRQRALAAVLRRRKLDAESLDTGGLVPSHCDVSHGHRSAELRSLAYHRAVAQRLDAAGVENARSRLAQWRAEERIDERWADAWADVLSKPLRDITELITADVDEAAELRQTSPFAGALTEQERRRILRVVAARGAS